MSTPRTRIIAIIILIILALFFGAYSYTNEKEMHPASQSGHMLSDDAYPLYSGFSWGPEESQGVGDLTGYAVTSEVLPDVGSIASTSAPFLDYYKDKLTAAGWTPDITREAGGPGSAIEAYRKDNQYILIGFQTTFRGTQPNAPVQCPCDMQFSVFSGQVK